jgi:hypothetical protein
MHRTKKHFAARIIRIWNPYLIRVDHFWFEQTDVFGFTRI